ncbi:MAG TPA: heavy metal translocating P-type ATPase, partial [Trueperaceae bacterium]|nr:heavy metal translocating P-type ATPase [Trueperaceae bacterium]
MAFSRSPAQGTTAHEFVVENMDCADCARTVEGALGHVNGVSDVRVNFTTQKLRLTLDEALVSRAAVERNLTNLGYPPKVNAELSLSEVEAQASSPSPSAAWYRTSKGRSVIATFALLAVTALLAFVFPPLAPWGFTAATLIGVAPLARKAWASTRLGQPFTINTLISVAALGAVAIGEAAEGAIVVFLFAVGELLENVATGRARAGIRALAALAPKVALLLEGGKAREVPVAALRPGDLVRVQPGGRVPADGTILEGNAGVDESPVTGESMPAYKSDGDSLFAGSISTDAVLTVRVDKPASDSTIARMIHLVEEAESSKAPVARFIDRFSRVYTPAAMLVATLVAVVPPLLFGASWEAWIYRALALLLIACPCALVLSVPAAVTSGISAGARRGLLIKGGAVLESIGDVKTVAFDKTGTLTENRPRVTDVVPLAASEAEVLRLAAAIETGSAHPLARAILGRAQDLDLPLAQDARAVAGQAVTATVDGRAYAVGSPRYAAERAPLPSEVEERIAALERQGKTVVVLLEGSTPLGLLAIRDEPRADAADAVKRLASLGVH